VAIPSVMFLTACLAIAQEPRSSLPISIELPRGRVYVGQAVDARLVIVAGAATPTISLGATDAVSLVALGRVEVTPRSSTTIGRATETTNVYRFPIRIVPKRAGTHSLPPIRAAVEGRTGILPPRTITAMVPPPSGRTSTFLGGIGRVEASVEVQPDSIRLGETFELRLRLDGPGSVGSAEPIAAAVLGRDGARWRSELLLSDVVAEPPSRTFRYRVRPDRAGTVTIPPFRVSTFDPASSTYQTTATRAVRIRVVDVPSFNAESVAIPTVARRGRGGLIAAIVALAGSGLGIAFVRWRIRQRGKIDPAKVASRLIAGLPETDDRTTIGAAVNVALAEFLHVVADRHPGAITPGEARASVHDLTGADDLAERAENLVELCDRSLYAEDGRGRDPGTVRAEAIALLKAMASGRTSREPREAPGTV